MSKIESQENLQKLVFDSFAMKCKEELGIPSNFWVAKNSKDGSLCRSTQYGNKKLKSIRVRISKLNKHDVYLMLHYKKLGVEESSAGTPVNPSFKSIGESTDFAIENIMEYINETQHV